MKKSVIIMLIIILAHTSYGQQLHINGSGFLDDQTAYSSNDKTRNEQAIGEDVYFENSWLDSVSAYNSEKGTFTDSRDEQTYQWVKIGDQVWMAENLNYASANSWCYDDNPINCDHYGRLYTWAAVMNGASSSSANPSGVQGVCPTGWHLPSDAEWTQLTNFVGSNPGKKLKAKCGWSNNGNGSDDFGFSALPGGNRIPNGNFENIYKGGDWWSATEFLSDGAWYRGMHYNYDNVYRPGNFKPDGFSVRCVKDTD